MTLILLIAALLPVKTETTEIPFNMENGTTGTIILTVPEALRVNSKTKITMTVISKTNSPLNLFTRFEIGGLAVHPTGEIFVNLTPKGKIVFVDGVYNSHLSETSQ